MNAGNVMVELRYDYGRSRCTPIHQQKQYLNHVCLSFTLVICIILNNFFIRLRRGYGDQVWLLTPLPVFSHTLIAVQFCLGIQLEFCCVAARCVPVSPGSFKLFETTGASSR